MDNREKETLDKYGAHDKDKHFLMFSDEPFSSAYGMVRRLVNAAESGKRKIPVIPIIAVGCILLILWITGGSFSDLSPVVLTAVIMVLAIGTVSCLVLYSHNRRKKEAEAMMKAIEAERRSGNP